MANKKDEVVEKPKSSSIKYFHLDEFLSAREEKLSAEIVNAFRVFLRGRLYQLSLESFEDELKAFLGRFNKKN